MITTKNTSDKVSLCQLRISPNIFRPRRPPRVGGLEQVGMRHGSKPIHRRDPPCEWRRNRHRCRQANGSLSQPGCPQSLSDRLCLGVRRIRTRSQLALAILMARGVPPGIAERCYQSFKWDCISRLPGEKFRLPIAVVDSWIQDNVYRAGR